MKREIAFPPTPLRTIQQHIIIPGTMEFQKNKKIGVMTPGTIENQQYQGFVNGVNQNQLQTYPQSYWPQSFAYTQQPSSGNLTYPQF